MVEQGGDGIALAALFLVVGSGFVATNLDNLLLLVGLLGAAARRGASVLLGYTAAAVIVLIVSLLGGMVGGLIDPALVGYLGVIPLLLGAWLLYRALFRHSAGLPPERATPPPATGGLSTFTLMISNSGDSIAVFMPLFAESDRDGVILKVVAYLALVLLWVAAAHFAAGRASVAGVLERYGRFIVPLIMMGVGVYILLDTEFDSLRQSIAPVAQNALR